MKEQREIKLYMLIFAFISVCFLNLSFIDNKFQYFALALGVVIIILISYSNFVLRRYFANGDKYLLIFSNLLAVIGIIMLFRLDSKLAIKQVIWLTLGICAFIVFIIIIENLEKYAKYKYIFLVVTVVMMSLGTLFGKETMGAKNWVSFFGISFQPSEIGKITLVLYLAAALKDYNKKFVCKNKFDEYVNKLKIKESIKKLTEPAFVVMVCLGFMVLQRDLGSALIVFVISITILYIVTGKMKYIISSLGLFVIGSVSSYFLFSHVKLRVDIWLDPWNPTYATGKSYQIVQGLRAICSGGFFGTGLGLGHPDIIPVVESDFIYAAICEEMGVLMGVAILLLYFILCYRAMRVAIKVKDTFSRLIVVGLTTMIAAQALVIVGGILGLIPLTGITLPWISYGGSSMLILHIALAIIQKVSEEA